jgi:membrane-associated phospholipid phosphatase
VLVLAASLQAAQPPPPDPAAAPAERPLHQFFQNLGRDLAHLPSNETLLLVGAGAGGALVARPADDDLQDWADGQGVSAYTRLGRMAGDGWVQGGAALATYGVGLLARDRRIVHLGSDLIRAQALNAVMTRGLKFAIGRRRPSGGPESLPSGHASASFATAAVLDAHFGAAVGIPAYVAAGFIGWTRVRDNAHWLTDVIVGGALGAAVGHTVARGHREPGWRVAPAIGPRSIAVHVVRLAR